MNCQLFCTIYQELAPATPTEKNRPKPPAQEGHKDWLSEYLPCQFIPNQYPYEFDFLFQPFDGI